MSEVSNTIEMVRYDPNEKIDLSDIEKFLDRNDNLDKKNLAIFGIMYAVRRTLPYGKWTCDDGREVLFNREYQPILQRLNGEVSYADRGEWVKNIVKCEMFYDDGSAPQDYLTKHLGHMHLDAAWTKQCKRSLLLCLQVLKEFTPKEGPSTNFSWSVSK
jgi:hypothetical protein